MSNDNKNLFPHDKLYQAVKLLVDALVVQASAKWTSSEEEEVIGAEVGAGWEGVYGCLGEIEGFAEAGAQAQTLERVKFYITQVKGIPLDKYDEEQLAQVVSEDDPDWYQPE